MSLTYTNIQYDYKCKIVCKKCLRHFHIYLDYSEFCKCIKQIGPASRYTGITPYSYNCPYCDYMRNTLKVEFVAKILRDDFVVDCLPQNFKPIDYAKIHKENKKRSLAK